MYDNVEKMVVQTNGVAERNGIECPVRIADESSLKSNYRQFHVLDEVGNESDSRDSSLSDSDVPDEEVERMLEEALVNKKRNAEQAGLG